MQSFNDFCIYCTANNKKEIIKCSDKYCVFYKDRFANLDYQDNVKGNKNVEIT